MCAQFALEISAAELRDLGIFVPDSVKSITDRFLPYKKIPVIVSTPQGLKLTAMNFSLVPAWSRESKVKFATYNARIETVHEKPAWREPFLSQHCLIPLSSFYESVYQGPHAGHIIGFTAEEKSLLFAAGLFDFWKNPETGESLFSCSIITTEPSAFILENGHDRTPIFLNFEDGKTWLDLKGDANILKNFLLAKNLNPDLEVSIDRALKAGWEKKI